MAFILFLILIYLILLFLGWIFSSPESIAILALTLISLPLYLYAGDEIGFEGCVILSVLGLFVLLGVLLMILRFIQYIVIPLWNWFCNITGWKKYIIKKKNIFGLDT